MNITNKIKSLSLIVIATIALSFTSNVSADNNQRVTSMCGLTTEKSEGASIKRDNGEVYYIEQDNGDICNEDIAYKVLYLPFGESAISSETGKKLFHLFYNPEKAGNNVVELSKNNEVGFVVSNLYSATTYLFITIFGLFMVYRVSMLIIRKASGEENNPEHKQIGLNAGFKTLFIGFLNMPLGVLPVIGVFILMLAVAGVITANKVLSSFLDGIGVQSTQPVINDNLILSKAETNTETLLAGNLCEMQTKQAILNNSYTDSSMYTEKSWYESILGFNLFGNDDRIGLQKGHLCTTYFEVPDIQENMIYSLSSKMLDYKTCDTVSEKFSPIKRLPEQSGYANECYKVNYTWPNDYFVETTIKSPAGINAYKEYKSAVENQYNNEFNYDLLMLSYKSELETIINTYRKNTTDTDYLKREKLVFALNVLAEKLQNNIKDNRHLSFNSSGIDNAEIGTLIYMQHLAALNYALGSYSIESLTQHISQRSDKLKDVQVSHMADTGNFGRLNSLTYGTVLSFANSSSNLQKIYNNVNFTGVGIMNEMYFNEMAKNILRSQCIANNGDINNKNAIDTYEAIKENPRDISKSISINFDCLMLEQKYGEDFPVLNHLIIDHNQSFTGIIKDNFKSLNTGNTEKDFEAKVKWDQELAEYDAMLFDIIEEDKLVITAYYYMVNKAFAMNVAAKLKEYVDLSLLVETRQKGFASLAGLMLSISQKQLSAASLTNDLNGTFNVSSFSELTKDGMTYVNKEAFYNSNTNLYENKDLVDNISVIDGSRLNLLMKTVNITNSGDFESEDAQERSMTARFTSWIVETLFSTPISTLKANTGLMKRNDNGEGKESLYDSLQRCSMDQDCISDNGHPVNGVISFGQQSVNQAINLILISNIVSVLNENIDKLPSPPIPAFAALAVVLKVLLAFVDIFLLTIKPFVYAFASAGILLGFFLPIMPYLFGFVLVIKWLVGIFVSIFGAQIFTLASLKLDSNNQINLDLKGLYKIVAPAFFMPVFITISVIFAWSLSNVAIYYVNSSAYMLFSLFQTQSMITQIVNTLVQYIVLMILYYVVLFKCFKFILELPNELGKTVGLQDLGGSSFSNAINIEGMMLARQATQGFKRVDNGLTGRQTSNVGKIKNRSQVGFDALRERINRYKEKTNITTE